MKLPGIKKYPLTLKIKNSLWEVDFVDNVSDNNRGICDSATRMIYIAKKMGTRRTLSTFLHEIIHAFEHEYDFDISSNEIKQSYHEEAILKLEKAMFNFILDNHKAIARMFPHE